MNSQQTLQDDAVMGALGQPNLGATCNGAAIIPYCQQEEFMNTAYCACQNTGVEWSECIYAPCQSDAAAYKTVAQREVTANAATRCPVENVCQNIIDLGGSNNVTRTYQTSNCGGTVDNLTSPIKTHPVIFIIVLILIVSMVMILGTPGGREGKRARRGGRAGI